MARPVAGVGHDPVGIGHVAIPFHSRGGSVVGLPTAPPSDDAGHVNDVTMYGSLFFIGMALALAGGIGVILPTGYRATVLLPLLAGAGVGIAGLAIGWSLISGGDLEGWWRVFFISSIAGFATVASGLAVTWRRARTSTLST
jgi:hypothetical protein